MDLCSCNSQKFMQAKICRFCANRSEISAPNAAARGNETEARCAVLNIPLAQLREEKITGGRRRRRTDGKGPGVRYFGGGLLAAVIVNDCYRCIFAAGWRYICACGCDRVRQADKSADCRFWRRVICFCVAAEHIAASLCSRIGVILHVNSVLS